MITLFRKHLFDFERSEARRHALVALLVVAFLSPDIPMPSPAPDLRLEQVLLGVLLPSLFLYYWRHPALRRRPMAVDWAFLTLGVAMTLSIIAAPMIVSQSNYSLRDPFEVARVVEYWLMFRIAYTALPSAATGTGTIKVLLWAGVGTGVFSAVQYLSIGSFNTTVTDIWADGHNLDTIITHGRAVGFVGNANYMGILSSLLLALALALVLLRYDLRGNLRWLLLAAAVMAAMGVVTSQSRTAAFSVLGAMFLGLVLVAATWRSRANYLGAISLFVAAAALSITFVEVNPPQYGSFHGRFNLAALNNDSSVTIRLSKLRSLFAGFLEDKPGYCDGQGLDDKLTKGHEPLGDAGNAPAPAEAIARDTQRKKDVRTITRGVLDYYCENEKWPYAEASLPAALVPTFMRALPKDPATGQDYEWFVRRDGFSVGAALENPNDTEGPFFALGTVPNIVLNPSFEDGKGLPGHWAAADEVSGRPAVILTPGEGLFGRRSVIAELEPTGILYHLVVFEFPFGEEWTANIWARSDSGEDETVSLYLIARLADGNYYDPLAQKSASLPASGAWVPVSLTFRTPTESRMFVLQYAIRAPDTDNHIEVELDAATVSPGPFAPSFPWIADVDPSRLKPLDLPGFADSPLLGVGPRKDLQLGAFDNEYALFLDRYGALGTLSYLALFISAFVVAFQARKASEPAMVVLSLAMMVFTLALASFNIAAGSYYHFQIMAVYWLLAGVAARSRPGDAALEEG